jgi:glucose-6-phosphate isomerase
MERLSLDYTLCMEDRIGDRGVSPLLIEAMRIPLQHAWSAVVERRGAGGLAWMELPKRAGDEIAGFAQQMQGRFDTLVVLGIGGSALGLTALSTALLHPYHNLLPASERKGSPRLFVIDNVDPDQIAGLFNHLDLRSTLVNVISKSGATAETMAAYLLARRLLEQQVGRARMREHLVFTTDRYQGVLRKIGYDEGIRMFDIPQGVGGRFSVLSNVGLLPAALTGMDVGLLREGAATMDAWCTGPDVLQNPAVLFALLQFVSDTRFHRRLSVMMPYSARLAGAADWYRQLWAESLGKAVDRGGETVHVGMTPVKALGATDQHSQIQLYTEGPDDKIITFLRVEQFEHDVPIPNVHPDEADLAYLAGHSFGELLQAEQRATAWALARRGRPSLTITLPVVDAGSLGQLFFLLETATAVAGELFDVDAFDQPGVELGKQAAYALMGRADATISVEQIEAGAGGDERYVLK